MCAKLQLLRSPETPEQTNCAIQTLLSLDVTSHAMYTRITLVLFPAVRLRLCLGILQRRFLWFRLLHSLLRTRFLVFSITLAALACFLISLVRRHNSFFC